MNKLVKYKIDEIKEAECRVFEKNIGFEIVGEDCEVTLTTSVSLLASTGQFLINYDVTYTDRRDKQKLLFYKAITVFGIWEFGKIFEINSDGNVDIPKEFFAQALSISIGAIRGMIALRTKDTYLEKVFLPVYNPNDLIESFKQLIPPKQASNS